MSAPVPVYRKVPGGGLSWKGHGGLWLADDHLLEVSSVFILEGYRRFFFQETRAFVVQRTNVRFIWAWVLGGVGAVFALIAAGAWWFGAANASEDWHIALYFPAVMFGLGALLFLTLCVINLSLGPSCRCHILTSTGWRALSAPTRLGRARRAQAQIASIIESTQGPPLAATTGMP
jgi:hypothetical protein